MPCLVGQIFAEGGYLSSSLLSLDPYLSFTFYLHLYIWIKMYEVPRSKEFDDVYFSVEDGFAETSHVFLQGNDLEARFAELPENAVFTIGETGFGTGLNFLAAWALFERVAPHSARLHFVSFEKFPLNKEMIEKALMRWDDVLGARVALMLKHYPLRIPGKHRVRISERVDLTLIFDDINDAIGETQVCIDAWFLDGFSPAKNPDMWTDTVFANMARMSVEGATLATFTAAGFVRRGLEAAGFEVEKCKGFGRKRDMVIGRMAGQHKVRVFAPKRVAVIGAGLAGGTVAYMARQVGHDVVVFEKGKTIAVGASGNQVGLVNPRFSALKDAQADFYMQGFALAHRTLSEIQETYDIRFNSCGNLFLANDEKKKERFSKTFENWAWDADHMRFVSADQASEIAGVRIEHEGLYLPEGASVSPRSLCEAYLDGVDVRLEHDVSDLARQGDQWLVCGEVFDVVVLACGYGVKAFAPCVDLPLQQVRGQVSVIAASEVSAQIKCNVSHKGYISAPFDGKHVIGATFQPWLDHTDVLEDDNLYNLNELFESIPSLESKYEVLDAKAGIRCASKFRKPIYGVVDGYKNLYVSTAHGSHGLVSSLMAARGIMDRFD